MEIHADLGNTVIMITHDVDEAVLLSDRIVMMANGPAATIGNILHVELERPRNRLELADNENFNHYRETIATHVHFISIFLRIFTQLLHRNIFVLMNFSAMTHILALHTEYGDFGMKLRAINDIRTFVL